MSWNFSLPVHIEFGANKISELATLLESRGLSHGILICDPIFTQNGVADRILALSCGRISAIYSNFTSNPTAQNVDDCSTLLRQESYQFAVSLGGGSSLDCAKASCSLCKTEDSIVDYMQRRKVFTCEHIPLIAIPTTAGTGSEVTQVAVLTDSQNGKTPLTSPNFLPLLAILDPCLTQTIPPHVTASTGLDVLSQALEGYWSKNHQPICDAAAILACKAVFEHLEQAVNHGDDLAARTGMCEASLLGGIAFATPKTSGPHVCSYPFTDLYHVPHGESCALTLESFLRLNAEAEGGRLHTLARMIGQKDAYALADAILSLKKAIGMRTRLSELGVAEKDLKSLVAACHRPNMLLNPVEVTDEILEQIFREIL